jgi:hypothetical protein
MAKYEVKDGVGVIPPGSTATAEGKIILKVFTLTPKIVAQLRAEKKATGDYSKSVTVEEDGYVFKYDAEKFHGSYPPISVNLWFLVSVYRENVPLMGCEVAPINCRFSSLNGFNNQGEKYKMYAWLCDTSQVSPLFKSGDTICIDNKGKAAFAKAEILAEECEDHIYRPLFHRVIKKLRLTKELGHAETLAYETNYQTQIVTYTADESTEEYFGGQRVLEKDLVTYYKSKEIESGGLRWDVYCNETVASNSDVQLTAPLTEQEILIKHKQRALEELLKDCQGEFCYGDKRVEKYRKNYLILGEDNIDTIYRIYKKWLNENCTKYTQDAASGEFTGIAIDWHGKEDQQPTFDVTGDVVKV